MICFQAAKSPPKAEDFAEKKDHQLKTESVFGLWHTSSACLAPRRVGAQTSRLFSPQVFLTACA